MIYAIVGESAQVFCNPGDEPLGSVLMNQERPIEGHYIATSEGTWEVDTKYYEQEERSWRDSELVKMDIAFRIATDRKQDTESISKYAEELRSWPEDPKFPDSKYRPEKV